MSERLKGAIALVTGASRGIGRAIALGLAEAGCDVAVAARSVEALEEVAGACREKGVRALVLPLDLTELEAIPSAVERCVEELGGLSVLVNNAGMGGGGAADATDPEVWDRMIDVNVRALMHLTRYALPHIERAEARRGVINIASISGKMSFAGGGGYCATKHAVVGFSHSVFEDVREKGIKVCAICPGYVNTPMVEGRGLDLAKTIQPEDIARTVRFVLEFPETGCPTEILVRPQRSP